MNEIGVIGHRYNTSCKANKSCDETIDEKTQCTKCLDFKVTEKESIMYWIPKMQKISIGARFIIASKICSAKQISKCISNVFKLVYSQIENFHKNTKFLSNVWVLQNSDLII